MKILITGQGGQGGQLAWELEQTSPDSLDVICLSSKALDISNQENVNKVLSSHMPDVVINAAAYTAVDKAETEQDKAYAVKKLGSEYLALACKALKAKLIHVSTDFVFDGTSSTPYQTDDKTNPINVYGASKLAGDMKIDYILGSDATILVRPIPANAYPTPAARPSFSVIDKTSAEEASGVQTTHWRKQLSTMMDELKQQKEIY
jgi:dTDP-4-dehydrorhamnose reductase